MSELISVAILAGLGLWGYSCYRVCVFMSRKTVRVKGTVSSRKTGYTHSLIPGRAPQVPSRIERRSSILQTQGRSTNPIRSIVLPLVVLSPLPGLFVPAHAAAQAPADFNVNSVADKVDANPGDGICSTGVLLGDKKTQECTLRAAIDEVNALSAANPTRRYTVSVMPGTYSLSASEQCTYKDFGNPGSNSTTTTVLCISGNMTLNGADQATTIVDHALVDRNFFVSAGYTVAINNMTIQRGAQYGGSFAGAGGGINNQGNLSLSNDLFYANTSQKGGAGVYNGGTLVVEGSTFLANTGPGIEADRAITSIDNSYFSQNTAYQGPAVSVYIGTLNISNSTASGNNVSENGIISSYNAQTTITNSTISNNAVGNAGAVVSGGNGSTLTLNNVTIAGNTAGNLIGGLFADSATMSNTILAGNTGFDCAVNVMTDLGHNLVQVPESGVCGVTNSTDLIGVDPKLDTVAVDGGSVPTQALLPGSPAIGAGSPAAPGSNAAGACTAIDQRGLVRGGSGACSIGAVELLAGLKVNNVSPNAGSPGGTARIVVHGSGFVPGSTLALRHGGQSIPLLQTAVAPDTFSITALLDLSTAQLGGYDVNVTTPAGASTSLGGGYTVEKATAPILYSYVYGPAYARKDRPDFYSVVYGNSGNADAYLVPLTFSIPGDFTGLISSPVLNPPALAGQVIEDWTNVPVEVSPYSKTGFNNVPLIVPVIPAGFSGVMQFAITPPDSDAEGFPYALSVSVGSPYSTALDGTADPAVLAGFVTGAQSYATANLGVTLTPDELAAMSTYASAQLAQEVTAGGQALLESAAGAPVLFSNAQLLIDIATYGASLANAGSKPESASASSSKSAQNSSPKAPDAGPAPNPASNPCSGGTTTAGPGCIPVTTPISAPISGTFTAADCADLANHYVSPNGTLCLARSPTLPVTVPGTLTGSVDPNEKDGPLGLGAAHFTLADDPFGYQVEFENTPTASAAAQTVSVTDPLDTAYYDLSTFELGAISFGPYVLTPPPGLTSFTTALDLRPTEDVIVAVRAGLDTSTGVASWNFTSLDPSTLQLVTDPTAGFLPPDTAPPAGIGHVAFSIKPLASVASGAKICNTASVVFDTNAAIATAPFCNSKDTTAPVSSVKPLAALQSSKTFTVSWSGSDAGVGVAAYTIYVSVDGGAFSVFQNATESTSASYTGSAGHSYGFYSIATDLLGNTEGPKTSAEATTTIGTGQQPQTITFGTLANQVYGATPVTLMATASSGLAVSYTVKGPAKLSGSTLTITGAGAVSVTASQAGNAAFVAATSVTEAFSVAKAALTVTANSLSRPYGAANPVLNFAITGFVNGDTAAVVSGTATLATTATSTSAAGTTYPITFTTKGLTAANYSFTYVNGRLTVVTSVIATTTTLVANPNTNLVAGQPITLTATVAPVSGAAIPTGAVTFTDPAGGSVTVLLDGSGKAVYKGVIPAAGTYTVFASYGGATGFAKSHSATIGGTVTAP